MLLPLFRSITLSYPVFYAARTTLQLVNAGLTVLIEPSFRSEH
jgi:hypothetical protein